MKRFCVFVMLMLAMAQPCLAARPLKQSTAVVTVVGPFVDTAGAAVTAPTIASIDITAYKNDGTAVTITPAASGSSNDMVHVDDGYFSLELTTTDTNTAGYLRLTFQISGALIFHEDFEVLPANIYDSRFDGGTTLQKVDVTKVDTTALDTHDAGAFPADVRQLLGTAWLAPGTAGTPDVNVKLFGATAVTGRDIGLSVLLSNGTGTGQVKLSGGYVAPNWGDVGNQGTSVNLSATTVNLVNTATTVTNRVTADVDRVDSVALGTHAAGYFPGDSRRVDGIALASHQSGHFPVDVLYTGGQPITLDANNKLEVGVKYWAGVATATDDIALLASLAKGTTITGFNDPTVAAIATGVWQDTTSGDFNVSSSIGKSLYTSGNAPGAASGLAIVGSNMGTVTGISGITFPTNFSTLSIDGSGRVTVGTNADKTGYRLSATGVDDVWDELLSGHSTSGSAGKALTDASAAGNPWSAVLASNNDAGTFGRVINDLVDLVGGVFAFTPEALAEAGGQTISPAFVGEGRIWRFDRPEQVEAPNIVTEPLEFDQVFRFELVNALAEGVSINRVVSLTIEIDDEDAVVPTLGTPAVTPDYLGVDIQIDAKADEEDEETVTSGTYTVTVEIKTTDEQILTRTGTLIIP